MKLFTAEQIKEWDLITTQQQGISSLDLMERAALKCIHWLAENHFTKRHFIILCGKGNNGGDGLAIARLLAQKGESVEVYILEFGKLGTPDFQANLERLHNYKVSIHYIQNGTPLPNIEPHYLVIDALLGAGLNKPLEGIIKELVHHINRSKAIIISIDVPSGLFLSKSSKGNTVIKATYTLTFQTYKLGLLLAENASSIGTVHLLDIGLSKKYYEEEPATFQIVDSSFASSLYKPRNRFSHKGSFGHALVVGGSYGKIGAVVLAATACARTGCGLLTVYSPTCGYSILQTALPEAMVITDKNDQYLSTVDSLNLNNYASIGVGPGLGTAEATQDVVRSLIETLDKPLVIDADALNCIAINKDWLQLLPSYSILTPHPKEFDRLFGVCKNEMERMERAQEQAETWQVVIVLKGHHTLIALPNGMAYFNMTGNAGMAKGGSGDVLTGILTSLLAQGYSPEEAAILGVYIHGLAGDHAARTLAQETMIASDLIHSLTHAFQSLH